MMTQRVPTLFTCVVALSACVPIARSQPLLTAYRCEAPPAIDGDLSDACWGGAVATAPFALASAAGMPDEQTRVRVCWDDARLYLGIEAMERNLDPRLNMLDLVRAEETARDAAVFHDDCVEIFLQPPGETYYHLGVNSIGTLYDAMNQGQPWDGACEVAATRGTDRYVIELAIGFESLGASPQGDWRANFCRERTAVEEWSTWSALQGGFHQPAEFGELRFAASGPTIGDSAVEAGGEGVTLEATVAGAADAGTRLEAVVAVGESRSSREATGAGRHALQLSLSEASGGAGRATVAWELTQDGVPVQRSAQLPVLLQAAVTRLGLTIRDAEAQAWLNGAAVALDADPVALDLGAGANVLALHASAAGGAPSVAPTVSALGRPVPVRWLLRTEEPPGGWREEIATNGWELTDEPPSWPEGAGEVFLVCGLYLGEPGPQLFPKLETFHLPRGSAQLMRFYVHIPEGVPTEGYRMVIEAPSGLRYRSLEPVSGAAPEVSEAGGFTDGDVQMTRYHLDYATLPGEGMELSLRWGNEQNVNIGYEPAITTGGTHDWRHLTATVTAPEGAATVHPLIIKWQNRNITGTFWVDNLVFREAGSEENLLKMGTFDEETWRTHSYLVPEGIGESMCCRIVSTAKTADRQQAMWVDDEEHTPVVPGREYVVELDAKCEDLGSRSARPLCGILFEAPEDLDEGEMPIYTAFQSLDGAITEIPRRSSVTVLPPLKDVRPERARIAPCYSSSRLTDPEVARAYAQSCRRSGITWTWGSSANNIVPHLLPHGHQVILHLPWGGWNPVGDQLHAYIEEHPDTRAMSFDGRPERHFFCPTWFLSDEGAEARAMLESQVVDTVREATCSNVNWDLEQPVVDPPTFCTCPRCITAFRQFAQIPEDEEITPETLLDQHRDAWVHFRCTQNATMAGLLREMVRKASPDITFSVYSGFQSKRTKEHYGVDWELMQPNIDLAIAGYGGSAESVRATLEAMAGKPFMGGEMWYPSHRDDASAAPRMESWRNRLLRKYVESGCTGVLIWQLASMDGGAFHATSEATAIIARYEDWFRHERRCDDRVSVEGLPDRDWAAFERDGEVLVLLMSFEDQMVDVTVAAGGEERDVRLEPFGTEVLLLR